MPSGDRMNQDATQSPSATDVQTLQYIALSLASSMSYGAFINHFLAHLEALRSNYLSILLYFPETIDPTKYVALVKLATQDVETNLIKESSEAGPEFDTTAQIDVSRAVVLEAMRNVSLKPLSISEFLDLRVRQIDANSGFIGHAILLLKALPEYCVEWRRGIVRPVASLRSCGIYFGIDDFEQLSIDAAIKLLFDPVHEENLEEMLQDGFIPWSEYNKTSHILCASIRDMLRTSAKVSLRNILRILSSAIQSNLDDQAKRLIGSAAISACYLKPTKYDGVDQSAELQTIVAILSNCFKDESELHFDLRDSYSSHADFETDLLSIESTIASLLEPSKQSITFLQKLVDASTIFGSVQRSIDVLLASVDTQERELSRLLLVDRNEFDFRRLRQAILDQAMFPSLNIDAIELQLLKTLLLSKKTDLAKKIYVTASPRPLKSVEVERAVLESFYELFDNARSLSRADLSQAGEVLTIIHPKHCNAEIRQAQVLVDSLIEISAYKGAQQFMPIQIRTFKLQDINTLLSHILRERGNYKKHFRLFGLYQNLCLALQLNTDEATFRELVVHAALSCDDLEFSLKYVEAIVDAAEDETEDNMEERKENGTWSLIFQISRYPTESVNVIRKQLGLMSRAISNCPRDKIHTLLALFLQLEKALESLENSAEEFDAWNTDADDALEFSNNQIPTQLKHQESSTSTSSARNTKIEMPQWKLFEAAQAATRAAREYLPKANQDGSEIGGRVRKRDQLAGLVGSGVGAVESKFSSGLGWILGAET